MNKRPVSSNGNNRIFIIARLTFMVKSIRFPLYNQFPHTTNIWSLLLDS